MAKELQNRAWSCLPKEFKEEVKKLYTDALDASNSPHEPDDRKWGNYRVALLEKLFGIHNLTSDAEGEEEKLYVKRKWVQEMYKNNCDEIRRENISSSDKDCYEYANEVLKTLFGSKCLPAETQEVTQFKFKVGDKVVYHPFKSNSFYNAEVLEIRDKEDKPYLLHLEDAENLWAYSIEVQSIAETYPDEKPKPAEPEFKVGDIVRFKYCCTPHRIDGFKMLDGVMLYQVGEVWAEESDLALYTEPLSQDSPENCDNGNRISNFDHIADDRKMVPSRLQITAMAMQGILSNPSPQMVEMPIDRVAQLADAMASILIAECEKGVHNGED